MTDKLVGMNTTASVGPRACAALGIALISLMLAGCGQKGPLKPPGQPAKPPAATASQPKA
ncbi:lipoprotein [Roseateles sp. DAIF2]|uniref:LPS translocon maturation chaperone LptM n=1 Tax=Roseateles sp. DAIF2 TaxID=2714952 RepID=UPI0035302E8E